MCNSAGTFILLASMLALSQAAPTGQAILPGQAYTLPYIRYLNQLRQLVRGQEDATIERNIDAGGVLRALGGLADAIRRPRDDLLAELEQFRLGKGVGAVGDFIDAFGNQEKQAELESVKQQEQAEMEGRFDWGNGARAIGGLIDAFGNQEKQAEQESVKQEKQAEMEGRFDWGNGARAIGDLIDAFGNQEKQAELESVKQQEQAEMEGRFDWGNGARAIGGLIDAFGNQEKQAELERVNYGSAVRLLGNFIDALDNQQATANNWGEILRTLGTAMGDNENVDLQALNDQLAKDERISLGDLLTVGTIIAG